MLMIAIQYEYNSTT